MAEATVTFTLELIALSIILGIIGQSIRIGIGLKKQFDEASAANTSLSVAFDINKLIVSVIMAVFVGGTAGVLYIVGNFEGIISNQNINQNFLLTLISVGYAGTDFIEGLLTKSYGPTKTQLEDDCEEMKARAEQAQNDLKKLEAL